MAAPPLKLPMPGKVGSPAYNAAYNNAFQQETNRLLPGALGFGIGTPTATPGLTTSPGQTYTLPQVLAGQAGGVGATVTGTPGTPQQYSQMGLPSPYATNLGAYSVTPDQYANPPATPGLDYLGLPNYSNNESNSDNGFAALFGAQNQGFASFWG